MLNRTWCLIENQIDIALTILYSTYLLIEMFKFTHNAVEIESLQFEESVNWWTYKRRCEKMWIQSILLFFAFMNVYPYLCINIIPHRHWTVCLVVDIKKRNWYLAIISNHRFLNGNGAVTCHIFVLFSCICSI